MEQSGPRLRLVVLSVLALVWMGAVLARLSYLQLYRYRDYLARARRQQERIIEVSPMRGMIYDRNGHELAMSIPVNSCFADPEEIADPGMVARLVSRVLGTSADDLQARLDESRSFVWIARKITPDQAARIRALNLRGIYFQKENKRFYPERKLAAHVLGYVDIDEHGLGGIEYSLDREIRGRPSRVLVLADARQRWYDRSEAKADKGDNVVLTIDENIQYIAEKALAEQIAKTHAKSGSVVVQNPNTGELLALANWPTFDPNDAGAYPDAARMDRAVSAAYEPGSIFKTILFSAALEAGVVRPADVLDCQMGSILVAGRLIHDWHPFGLLTAEQVLIHSSDVGSIKIALRLGASKYYHYIRQFGFGQLTGITLPGENRGLLRPVDEWSPSSIGSIAIGQEVSVTPIQMVSAISAIANGGTLYRAQIVRQVLRGKQVVRQEESDPRRVLDPRTAATVREMMEQVVLQGTGRLAQPMGYTAAGKTGTAQKIDPATGRYSRTKYVASFAGFAPVNSPAVTILVDIDSPVGPHEGGEVAAPVFREVAEQVLAYLNVPHDVPETPKLETASLRQPVEISRQKKDFLASQTRKQTRPPPSASEVAPAQSAPTVAFGEGQSIVVPQFYGQTVRRVTEACSRMGLMPVLVGDGIALEQSPEPGAHVLPGTRVLVHFGRASDSSVPRGKRY